MVQKKEDTHKREHPQKATQSAERDMIIYIIMKGMVLLSSVFWIF